MKTDSATSQNPHFYPQYFPTSLKILMGHEDIESTDRYLRAVAIDTHVLADVLDTLLAEKHGR
jgi:hypothetical protein